MQCGAGKSASERFGANIASIRQDLQFLQGFTTTDLLSYSARQ